MQTKLTLFLSLILCGFFATAQTTKTIADGDLVGGQTYNWSKDTVYQLDGYVYLEEGGVLNIEPGTRIEGLADPTSATDLASTLIITRGATINAVGTIAEPIVFTAEGEDGSFTVPDDRGSWGGLIILGRATVGEENATGEANVEGIPQEDRTTYGGTMDDDNSGMLRYVSIRYGGATLADNNEINGLTLGGVGSGTVLEYIEVFGNSDDGIEFFGGTVDLRYAVVAFCKDDSFDSDQAWSGRGQFLFTVMLPNDQSGNNQNGGEHDGSENPADNGGPVQTFYNATYIGMGTDMDNGESNTGLRIKSGGAVTYVNSIFTDFGRNGIRLQDNAYDRFLNDEFEIKNNLWYAFGGANDATNLVRVDDGDDAAAVATELLAAGNQVVDPLLNGVSRMANGMLDPRPGSGSPARTGAATPDDDWFIPTTYVGAFSPRTNWAEGWTHLDELGYFGDLDGGDGNVEVITDADLQGNTTYNWTSDKIYQLDGYVYLEAGSVLNIEAGTRIEGLAEPSNQSDLASTLIIARGAKINALGTAEAPIVFTAEGEDGNFTVPDDRGSWGGLIILGNALVGEENGTGEANVEGIPQEARTTYGGTDTNDDSGTLRYISIRYGGATLADNNEINGLTLGGVGKGTTIEYIEVFGNSDDGIEFFGGSVDLRYAVVAFCKDDSFDSDQGWSGRGQYWFTIMLPNDQSGNNQNGGEHDGSENPADNGGPVQTVYNATYLGMGSDMDNGESNTALRIKSGGAISYTNSIFAEFGRNGIRLQDNAYDRYFNGDFEINNNIWYAFGGANDATNLVRVDDGDDATALANALIAAGNTVEDPLIAGISRMPNGGLDPRPGVGSPAFQSIADIPADDDFFQQTGFRGAFPFGNNWAADWTHMDELGYFGDLVADKPLKNIQDEDLVGNTTYNWSADTIYILDGYVFLEAGGVLNIAPGTVIQGGATPSDANDLSSALVITRGAQINAIGTAEEPIIFTAEGEDGNFTIPDDRGSWGGLIILGNARVGEENGTGFANVEGIPQEDRTTYGGGMNPVEDDNSGTLRYVSIRYGGATLADNNEINGLTLGGVGNGTDISYIEVYGNSDDGIEFFGGSVDVKYASVIFCKDDSFDSDQSWSGRGQFWFTLQLPNDQSGNNQNGGEHDGSENPADNGGAVQTIWNATYIGMGADMDNGESNTGLRLKSGAAVNYGNSIFTEFGRDGLRIQDNSYDRFLAGDYALLNNIWWNFGDGNTPADFVRVDDGDDAAAIITLLTGDQANTVEDPQITQVSWDYSADGGSDGNGTDPRPAAGSPVTSSLATIPNDDFYTEVNFKGAFSNDATEEYWVTWTHAFDLGLLVDLRTGVSDFGANDAGVRLAVPAPNPAAFSTNLNITLPETSEVSLMIYDQMGRAISERALGNLVAGEHLQTLDVSNLISGHYFIIIKTNRGAVAQRMVVNR